MIGLSLQFSGESWGCGHFDGQWAIKPSDHAKWTDDERVRGLGETVMRLKEILEQAKVRHVEELVGIPVECTFEGMTLTNWRVLMEVL